MLKRIFLALLALALVALPAYASVQNVKVSGSIDTTWLVRDQFDLGDETASTSDFYQNLLITQAILRVDADLTDNVSAVISLINEREWGDEGQYQGSDGQDLSTEVAINLAYVTLREMIYSPLTVMIGRQQLYYGHGLIIGNGPNNAATGRLSTIATDLTKRTAFDAIRLILDYDPLTIDIVASKVDENTVTGVPNTDDDVDLYGINANYQLGDEKGTEIELYFWNRIQNNENDGNKTIKYTKADKIYSPGIKVSSNLLDGLYTSAEIAWQFGTKAITTTTAPTPDNVPREAMAIQLISSYSLPFEKTKKYEPVITSSYTWLSGDSNPTDQSPANVGDAASDNVWNAWDPMYEGQSGGTIYNTLFSYTNCHLYNLALQGSPLEDVMAKLSWTGIWLDKTFDHAAGTTTYVMNQPDGTTATLKVNNEENFMGWELDGELTYDYTEDVKLGLLMGWYFPGDVFQDFNDDVAKQFLTSVKVNF